MKNITKITKRRIIKLLKTEINDYDNYDFITMYETATPNYVWNNKRGLVLRKRHTFNWVVKNILKEIEENFEKYIAFNNSELFIEFEKDNNDVFSLMDYNKITKLFNEWNNKSWIC